MDHPQINLESFHHEKRADGAVIVRIQTSNLYKEGKVVTTSVYTVFSDGTIDLKTTFLPQGVLPEIPRFRNRISVWRLLMIHLPGMADGHRITILTAKHLL